MTPNPTTADRLEAALNAEPSQCRDDKDGYQLGGLNDNFWLALPKEQFDLIKEAAAAHLADLRRENTRTASASMEAKDGWKMVPIEPTEVMLHEGASVGPDTNEGAFGIDFADIIYRAMLNAAPPTALEGEE